MQAPALYALVYQNGYAHGATTAHRSLPSPQNGVVAQNTMLPPLSSWLNGAGLPFNLSATF
ncbi:MAG: hypothetical protein R3A44_12710 [Caldilineaceae bacterium]